MNLVEGGGINGLYSVYSIVMEKLHVDMDKYEASFMRLHTHLEYGYSYRKEEKEIEKVKSNHQSESDRFP